MNATTYATLPSLSLAYDQLLSFVESLDAMWIHKRINGKFASASDVATLRNLSDLIRRIYTKKRDTLLDAGMSWDEALDYAAAHALAQYNYAQTNDHN